MATCSRCPNKAIARSHKPYPQFHETDVRLQEPAASDGAGRALGLNQELESR
jgi:hypothetical protein